MSEVKRWYIGVYGGEAQARGCSPHAREIIRETQGETFVLAADFDRVTAERDALQQRLTAADERADALENLVPEAELALKALNVAVSVYDVELADSARRGLRLIIAALKPAAAAPDFSMIGTEKMPPMEYDEP